MPSRPWYPKHTGDYARDTRHLTLEEHGAYNLVIDLYWDTGPLPADERLLPMLRKSWGISLQKTRSIWEVLSKFFQEKDGFFHHKRIDKEILICEEKHRVLSESGKRGNDKRWSPGDTPPDSPGVSLDHNHIKEPLTEGVPPSDSRQAIWTLGVALLGDSPASRQLLGKLAKDHGEETLARAIGETAGKRAADPKTYLLGILKPKQRRAVL